MFHGTVDKPLTCLVKAWSEYGQPEIIRCSSRTMALFTKILGIPFATEFNFQNGRIFCDEKISDGTVELQKRNTTETLVFDDWESW